MIQRYGHKSSTGPTTSFGEDNEGNYVLYADCEQAMKEKDGVISRLRSDLCDANIRYGNALTLCREKKEQIAALEAAVEEKDTDIQLLGDSLNGLNEQIAALKAELQKYKEARLAAVKDANELQDKNSILTAENTRQGGEIDQWKRVVVTHVEEIAALNREIAKLTQWYETSRRDSQMCVEQIAGLRENKLYLENGLALKMEQIAALTAGRDNERKIKEAEKKILIEEVERNAALTNENKRLHEEILHYAEGIVEGINAAVSGEIPNGTYTDAIKKTGH